MVFQCGRVHGQSIHRGGRLHVRKLGANSQNHENGADGAGVVAGETGGVGVADVELLAQPIFFDVEIIGLGVFEENLDEEIGDKTGRETGNGGGDLGGAGLELGGAPSLFKGFGFGGGLRLRERPCKGCVERMVCKGIPLEM